MFLKARDSAGLLHLIQLVSGHPEAGGSHLCLPTHHQLTQSMVDELILHLQDEGRHLRDTQTLQYELNIHYVLGAHSISRCMYQYIGIHTYRCLHHLHALCTQLPHTLAHTESALGPHLLQHHVQSDEGARATHTRTAVHQQGLVQGDRVKLTHTTDEVVDRHEVLWHAVIRPGSVVELSDCQLTLTRPKELWKEANSITKDSY